MVKSRWLSEAMHSSLVKFYGMELRDGFVDEIKSIIEQSRVKAIRSVDHIRVRMYWELGRKIVEEEQQGKQRAEYGKFLIQHLSEYLQPQFGSGYNKRQLERCRQLYGYFPIAAAIGLDTLQIVIAH